MVTICMQGKMNTWFHYKVWLGCKYQIYLYEEEFAVRGVGSMINCCKPNWDATVSTFKSWEEFISFLYQSVVFALKLPKATTKNGYLVMIVSNVNSKVSANVSKVSGVWLGDLYKQRKSITFRCKELW